MSVFTRTVPAGIHENPEDRRRFPRVRAPIFFQIPRLRDEHRPVLDVSLGGLRVYSDDAFTLGERFQLELLLPPNGTEISALAQVAWIEALPPGAPARFDVGFELLIVDDDGLRLLGRALEAASAA